MPARLDPKLHSRPAVDIAGLEAMGLWVRALSWSCAYRTDGLVTRGVAQSICLDKRKTDRFSGRLVAAGLWEAVGDDFRIVDFPSMFFEASRRRPSIGPAMRAAIIARDGLICAICGVVVALTDVHIDHRVPVARGGPTTESNLRVTHSVCNLRKGTRLESECL